MTGPFSLQPIYDQLVRELHDAQEKPCADTPATEAATDSSPAAPAAGPPSSAPSA